MPTEDESKSSAPKRAPNKIVRAPNFVEAYANSSQGAFTAWDIQLAFGTVDRIDGEPVTIQRINIIFSPQHAKAALKIFEGAIRGYEERYGEVKVSDAHRRESWPIPMWRA
jgi:hypothetical protein